MVFIFILQARQQEHSKEMSVLELKAQREMLDATKELNNARQRTMEVTQTAAEAVTRLHAIPTGQQTTRKVTPRSRPEINRPLLEVDNIRPRKNKPVSWLGNTEAVKSDQ